MFTLLLQEYSKTHTLHCSHNNKVSVIVGFILIFNLSPIISLLFTTMVGEGIVATLRKGEEIYKVIHPEIGRGNSGIVYRTSHPKVCAKKVTVSVDMTMDELKEFKKMQDSRFIVKYLDFFKVGHEVWELMEYCSLGNLEMYMADGRPANLARQMRISHQIAQGLQYLHSHGITHRDIIPANIVVQYERNDSVAKLCNFSVSIAQVRGMTDVVGSDVYFKAPELFQKRPEYDKSIDTFALGLISLCMLRYENVEGFNKWRPCSAGYCNEDDLPENYCIGRELLGARQKHLDPLIIVSRDIMDSERMVKYKDLLDKILTVKVHERMNASEINKELEEKPRKIGVTSPDHAADKHPSPPPAAVVPKSSDTVGTPFALIMAKYLKDGKTNHRVKFGQVDQHRQCIICTIL